MDRAKHIYHLINFLLLGGGGGVKKKLMVIYRFHQFYT